jgi:hypothetical protein
VVSVTCFSVILWLPVEPECTLLWARVGWICVEAPSEARKLAGSSLLIPSFSGGSCPGLGHAHPLDAQAAPPVAPDSGVPTSTLHRDLPVFLIFCSTFCIC